MEAIATTKIEHYLREIVARLKPLKPYKIVLFGSHATGTATEDSDIDLYIVTNDEFMPRDYEEKIEVKLKIARLLRDVRKNVPIDLVVHTKPMYQKFLQMNSSLYREILKEGSVLYECQN